MLFSDLALARRLEAAEGFACAQFAEARRRLFPDSGSEAIRVAGADVVYDGVGSPTTQTFGLGMLEDAGTEVLDTIEAFFTARGSTTQHEISPFAGVATLQLLCARGYRPIEISNVLCRPVEWTAQEADLSRSKGPPDFQTVQITGPTNETGTAAIGVRVIRPDESSLWTEISTRGWTHEHPELEEFMGTTGGLLTAREGTVCFLAEIDNKPAAAGCLLLHGGVALLAGAATVPEYRRRGLQSALLDARLRYAGEHGCDLAMMVAEAGSNSQRNAQRAGFSVAYTRIKWEKE